MWLPVTPYTPGTVLMLERVSEKQYSQQRCKLSGEEKSKLGYSQDVSQKDTYGGISVISRYERGAVELYFIEGYY